MDVDAVTPQEIAAARDSARIPDRAALGHLLETYFVGPVDAAVVARLEEELQRLLADPGKRASKEDAFYGNRRRYFGQAWKEVLSNHDLAPAPTELAVWIAVTDRSYPRPKPYCPSSLVGAWQQVAPTRASWQVHGDGTLETDEPRFASRKEWCVHRLGEHPTLAGDELWLREPQDPSHTLCSIREITATNARWFKAGGDGRVDYDWERA